MPDSDETYRPLSRGAFFSEHRDSRSTPDPASCNRPADLEPSYQPAPAVEDMPTPDPSSPLWPPDLPGGVAMQESILRTTDAAHARVRDDPSILSDEVASRAVGNPGDANDAIRGQAPIQRPPAQRAASPPADLYMSDSEMTDTLSEMGGVPLGPYLGGQMALDSWVEHFVNTAIARHQMATISEDSDDDDDAGLIMDYETPMEGTPEILPLPQEDDLDDTHKFYSDDVVGGAHDDDGDGDDDDDVTTDYHISEDTESLSEVDFDDFYRGVGPVYDAQFAEVGVVPGHDDHNYFPEGEDPNAPDFTDPRFPPSVVHGTTHEKNFTIDQFIQQWMGQSSAATIPGLPPLAASLTNSPISSILAWKPPAKITRPSRYPRDFYDIQQIPWWQALRVHRSDARDLRDLWYTSYHNVEYSEQRPGRRLPQEEFYFREKAMYTKCKAAFEHFQLRNLMSVAAYNTVHFAHKSKLYSWIPAYDDLTCLIDLSKPRPESGFQGPVRISTMKSAHDVVIAGGFNGEYALRAVGTDGAGVEGFVTKEFSGITNHVDIVPSRSSRSPLGIFASNDRHLRVLDCETNTFIADHELSRAINCTSTSEDGRLRVVIGDSPDAWVVEADTGRPVHPLRGHRDFGFACAWSPDMRHIATSNQDKTVIIWDARTWRILERIESDIAGYRSLRFSPVGGGPRTLLLCEPADRIAVVNAQTYQTRQVHDFFGEIGGADYSADGATIWVANTDEHVGGFMEYERRQWGQRYGPRELAHEWVREAELDEDARCVLSDRERQMRFWWNLSDEEHEQFLV